MSHSKLFYYVKKFTSGTRARIKQLVEKLQSQIVFSPDASGVLSLTEFILLKLRCLDHSYLSF